MKTILFWLFIGQYSMLSANCTDPDSTRRHWTDGERMKNFISCVGETSKLTTEPKARKYCACLMDKIESKMPVHKDYEAVVQQGRTLILQVFEEEIGECSRTHITQPQDLISTDVEWNSVTELQFKSHCLEQMKSESARLKVDTYCSCLTEKMKFRFPNYSEFVKKSLEKEQFNIEIRPEMNDCLFKAIP
jgi:hypothetical protein